MKPFLIILTLFVSFPAIAWDGYDYDTGNYIEIHKGNLVRSGRSIEIYEEGDYKEVEVEDINRYGNSVEVEVYDYDTGEYRTFEMDD